MFKSLIKKIQEEGASPDREPTFSHGPGLASPKLKDSPGGGIPGTKRESSTSESSRRDSLDSVISTDDMVRTRESTKEEVLALLMKRTDQVKRLEAKVSELAAKIKEKNRNVEQLENALSKVEESSAQKLKELQDQCEANTAQALKQREQDMKVQMELLEKNKIEVEKRLQEAEQYKNKYFKLAEEDDELQGFSTQELAKVKHMLLNTQEDLGKTSKELEEKKSCLERSEKRVKDLETEVGNLTDRLRHLTNDREKIHGDFTSNRSILEQLKTEKSSLTAKSDNLSHQLNQKTSQLSLLQSTHQDLQDEHMALQRHSDLHRQKMNNLLEEKDERISQLEERVVTLEQRIQDSSLSGDDQLRALETERDTLEKKLQEARQQLTEVKSTWSDKITHLEEQISHLNGKMAEDAEEVANSRRQVVEARQHCQRQMEDLQSRLDDAEKQIKKHLEEIAERNKQLDRQKQEMEAEVLKCKENSSVVEVKMREKVQKLQNEIESLDRAREKERTSALQKITLLESTHDEWLEKEIDNEKQITEMENQLQKYKSESLHRERDNARLQQQLDDRSKEIKEIKEKMEKKEISIDVSQGTIEQLKKDLQNIGVDFQACTKEKNNLLLRNAELSQTFEAYKRNTSDAQSDLVQQVKDKDNAIAGLEQSLQDLSAELSTTQEKFKQFELAAETAKTEMESAEINRMKKDMSGLEDQLADRNKTIKVQQQRLTDLKKTLQRELKVQALPNDEPTETNNHDAPQLEISGSQSVSHLNRAQLRAESRTFSSNTLSHGGSGNGNTMTRGIQLAPLGARTVNMMTRCSVGNDCLCEHVNFEYLKHVVIKFMTSRETEAMHLIRAVAVLLHLSQEEQAVIRDTLEWKRSWGFASRPKLGQGQMAKVIPPSW